MAGTSLWNSLFSKVKQYAPTKQGVNSAGEAVLHAPFDVAGFLGDLVATPVANLPHDARLLRALVTGDHKGMRNEILANRNPPHPVTDFMNKLHDVIHTDTAAPTTPVQKYIDAGIRGGPAGVASQIAQDTVSDKNPYKPAIVDAAGLAGMVVPGMLKGRAAPDNISLSTDIVPYKKPSLNDDGSPKMGQFASQKDAALHMRANGYTPATHDIVAHGDDSYSLVPKPPTNITPDDFNEVPQTITPDDYVEEPKVPTHQGAPLAPDGFPGNGSVKPIDPTILGKIMGNQEGAWDGVTPPAPLEDAAADKPVVDNTGYEKFTPNATPPAPANDPHQADIVPITDNEDLANLPTMRPDIAQHLSDQHDAAMNEAGYVRSVVDGRWLTRDEAHEEAHQLWVDKNFPEGTEVRGYGHNIDKDGNYLPDDAVRAIEDQDSELAKARQNKFANDDSREVGPNISHDAKTFLKSKGFSNMALYQMPVERAVELAMKHGWEPPVDPNAPSHEEITATPGVNARRMAKMLGPQLYGDPSNMGSVTIKEVMQNSFDAIKDAMAKRGLAEGKLDIKTDRANRTITMHDNGIGMAPETLGGKFLQIAGTGKEGDNSSGGFGIAKMLFLYGNKELHVTTMRDGKVSEMHTTGEQLFDALEDPSHSPKIQVRTPTKEDHETFPHGHGTKISLKVPETFTDPQTQTEKEIAFPHTSMHGEQSLMKSPLFHNVEVAYNGSVVRSIGKHFPKDEYSPFTHVKFGWGSADIYVQNEPEKYPTSNNVHYLSNGLHQFSKKMGTNPGDPWSKPIPHNFYIDIHPTVKPEEPGYPFNFNRQGLTQEAQKELSKVTDYIHKLYAHKSLATEAKSFGTMHYIDPQTGKWSDPQELFPDIPVQTKGFEGLKPGDEVTIRDGRMFVNGKEKEPLTPDQLKDDIPSHEELMVNPALIDAHSIMVHDNTTLTTPNAEYEGQSVTDHMRMEFGEHFDDMVRDVGKIFMEIRNMVSELGPEYHDLLNQAIGVSFDREYRGVNIRVPFKGQFVNPLVPESNVPLEQGYGIIGTMVHELAHEKVRSHNADFPAEMQRLQMKLAASHQFMDYWSDKARELTKYADVFEYGKSLFDKGYVEPRAQSFEDGAYDERPKGGDEGDASGLSQSREGSGGTDGVSEGASPEYPSIEPRSNSGKGSGSRGQNAVIRKLVDVLEQGREHRLETTRKISAERSERIRAAMAAGKNKTGREALYAELKALKGDMSRAYIQPIAQYFTPEEIDGLLDLVKKRLGNGFEGITARKALDKLFDEKVGLLPTEGELKLLQKALPHSVIKALMGDESGSVASDWIAKYGDPVAQVAGISRALKTIGDFGVAFRQCIPLIGTKAYWTQMKEIFKGVASEKMFQKTWDEITSDPDYYWMQTGGVAFSNLNHHDLSKREEFAPSPLAEKLPLVRRSERGYTGYLNAVRYHTFKRLLEEARKYGIEPTADTAAIKQLGKFVNMMTGRGDLGKVGNQAAPFLSSMFFAPRLAFSRIQLMLQGATFWTLPPYLRKELAKGMISYSLYMGVILGIANGVGSHFGVHVEMDPRSTEFARIQVGDTYFDTSGSFQPYVRTFWQFITGEKKSASGEIQPLGQKYGQPTRLDLVFNFAEGKASPNAAFIMDLMRGPDFMHPKDIMGETHDFKDFSKEHWNKNPLVNLVMPMGVGAGIEAGQDYGPNSILPYAAGVAETFGIGAKTYKPRVKSDHSKNEFGNDFSKNDFGNDFSKDEFQ